MKFEDLCCSLLMQRQKFTEERKKTRKPISFFQHGNLSFKMFTCSCEMYSKSVRSSYISALRVARLRSKLWLKRQPVKLLFTASYFSGFSEAWGLPSLELEELTSHTEQPSHVNSF